MPISSHCPFLLPSPVLHPCTTTNLFSVSIDLPVLEISYKWNHTNVFCEWFLSLSMLASFIHIVVCTVFIAKYYPINWIYHILSFYQLIVELLLQTFLYKLLCTHVFGSFRFRPWSWIPGSHGNCIVFDNFDSLVLFRTFWKGHQLDIGPSEFLYSYFF